MTTLKARAAFIHAAIEYNLDRVGVKIRDEQGAVSTETALIMAALVAMGIAVAAILIPKASLYANCVPDPGAAVAAGC